jgi:hypothetical protein
MRNTSVRTLVVSLTSTVIVIFFLLVSGQGVIQYALHQEVISRQVYALIAAQGIASSRLQRNSLLILAPGQDRAALDRQMQADLATLESNHARYQAQFANMYPILSTIGKGKPNVYQQVDSAARQILAIEAKHLPQKEAEKEEGLFIIQLFYAGNEHIDRVIQALAIVENETDAGIWHIVAIELTLFAMTIGVYLFEIFGVLRPVIRRVGKQFKIIEEVMAPKKPPDG